MSYIKAAQFLKQSEKVQDVLKKWAELNLQERDWVSYKDDVDESYLYIDSVLDTRKDNINVGRVFYIGNCLLWNSIHDPSLTPLFTETQLRKFIDDNTGGIVAMKYLSDKAWWIVADEPYRTETDNLLQAYWQVACKIAGEVENERD